MAFARNAIVIAVQFGVRFVVQILLRYRFAHGVYIGQDGLYLRNLVQRLAKLCLGGGAVLRDHQNIGIPLPEGILDFLHICAELCGTPENMGRTVIKTVGIGRQIKDVQEWLGHSDIKMTANIYGHLDVARKQSIADKMGSLFPALSSNDNVRKLLEIR